MLPHLVPTLVWATREDKLPYMRPYRRALGALDLAQLAVLPVDVGWQDEGNELRGALLGHDRVAPLPAMVDALHAGAGAEGVLSVVSQVVGERLLGYDLRVEFDPHHDFGWLDITHGLTHASAVRWAWREQPGADTLQMVAWAVFLVGNPACHLQGRCRGFESLRAHQRLRTLGALVRIGLVPRTCQIVAALGLDPAGQRHRDLTLAHARMWSWIAPR